MRTRYILPLILLPVFFTLHRYLVYTDLVPVADAVLVLLRTLATSLVLFLLLNRWRKDLATAAMMTLALMTFHFFFGELRSAVAGKPGLDALSRYRLFLPITIALLLLVIRVIVRTRDLSRFAMLVNIILAAWILMDLATAFWKAPEADRSLYGLDTYQRTLPALPAGTEKPDIYYLVFDSHPSAELFRSLGVPDTIRLDSNLAARGFQVASAPRSNYHKTPLSMSATFNLGYIRDARAGEKPMARTYTEAVHDIDRSRVPDWFQRSGYALVNLSMFRMQGKDPIWKEDFLVLPPSDMMLYPTFTRSLARDLFWSSFAPEQATPATRMRRDQPLKRFNHQVQDSLTRIIDRPGGSPRFVYAHLYLPHPPYFHDARGNAVPDSVAMDPKAMRSIDGLMTYLSYTDRYMLDLVDRITARDPRAVIVIQSDHGFGDLDQPLPPDVRHRNITAVRLPGKTVKGLDGMTNINTFPVVLHELFGLDLPRLKDSIIITR